MFLFSSLKSNRGMTLVEVLIVAALAGLVAIASGSIIYDLNKALKRIQLNQAVDLVDGDIQTLLINRDACRNTFQPLGNLALEPVTPSVRDKTNVPRFDTVTDYENKSFRISEFKVRNFVPPATPPGQGTFDIVITYAFLNSSVKPPQTHRTISFAANLDAANQLVDCWSAKSSEYDSLYINTSGPPETKTGDLTLIGVLNVKVNGGAGGYITTEEYYQTSDRRLKKDIYQLTKALDALRRLDGVQFRWKSDDRKDWGFIAQEVEKVAPALVHTDPQTQFKSVNYNGIIALAVEGLKSLEKENRHLEQEVKSLRDQVDVVVKKTCEKNPQYDFCIEGGH